MAGRRDPDHTGLGPHHPFRVVYRQAGYRWLILMPSLALLVWLGFFAGRVRTPGGVKRQWAVTTSRVMAAVGGIFLIRLLLFSHEERVPVVYARFDGGGAEKVLKDWINRLRSREETIVPLTDVVAFMAERRYVPRGGMALVIGTGTIEDAQAVAAIAGGMSLTVLLPPEALGGRPDGPGDTRLPAGAEIGASLAEHPSGGDRECLAQLLRDFAGGADEHLGKRPVCARVRPGPLDNPRELTETSGYACLLGGAGYNRFGDTPYLVRLLDVSEILRHGRQTGLNMRICIGMFKGGYIWWPVAAVLRALGVSPGWA